LPAVTLPYLRSKKGFSFARFSAVVVLVRVPRCVEDRHHLRAEAVVRRKESPGLLGPDHARVAARRELVHLAAGDAEPVREVLGGLAHQQADVRVGEALHDRDHRGEKRGAELRERSGLLPDAPGAGELREPQRHRLGVEERRPRQGVDAARQHEIRPPGVEVRDRGVERLHARGAVPHHRPAGDLLAAAHAERHDASDVDLVDRRRGAAEDHLVERRRLERLAVEHCPPRRAREVARRERTGLVARLEERGPAPVDDVGRAVHVRLLEAKGGR
jgi:hypothetical protein